MSKKALVGKHFGHPGDAVLAISQAMTEPWVNPIKKQLKKINKSYEKKGYLKAVDEIVKFLMTNFPDDYEHSAITETLSKLDEMRKKGAIKK